MSAATGNGNTLELVPESVGTLERKADLVRGKLIRTVDALTRRRHEVVEIGENVAIPIAISIAASAALLGTSIVIYGFTRRQTLFDRIMKKIEAAARPSLARRMFDKVALTAVSVAANEIMKRQVVKALEGKKVSS